VFLSCGKNLTLCGVLYTSQNNKVNALIKFQFDSCSLESLSWLLRGFSSSRIFHFPFLFSNDIAK